MVTKQTISVIGVIVAVFGLSYFLFSVINKDNNSNSRSIGNYQNHPKIKRPTTDDKIRIATGAIAQRPRDPRGYDALGSALIQKVRETGKTELYFRAESSFQHALKLDPKNAPATIGLASIANSRHAFGTGLGYAKEARRLAPGSIAPYAVLVDSMIELGQYQAADKTLQKMIDLKPDLASYTRASYWRELHGDLAGAIDATQRAVSAGGDVPEASAFTQTLLGKLEFARGNFAAARRAYLSALQRFPRYIGAEAELGKLEASERNFGPAIQRLRSVTARIELPEYVLVLAEVEQAAGQKAAAKRDYAEALRREMRLLKGGQPDADTALIQAAAGTPKRAIYWAKIAWHHSPSIRSADALGWALTKSGRPGEALIWAKRALKLGSQDPRILFHAGVAAFRSGHDDLAHKWMSEALANNPRFSPLLAPQAEKILALSNKMIG